MFLTKLASVLLAIIMFFGTWHIQPLADSMDGRDFTIIAPEEKSEEIITRVMSYNVRCGDVNGVKVQNRIGIVAGQINEIQPDSFGVQEATPYIMSMLNLLLPQYDYVGIDRDEGKKRHGSGEYCAVFYLKSKYKVEDSGTFWLSETPDVPSFGPGAGCRRICTWAILKDKITRTRYVHVNSHLDHVSEDARVQGAGFINDFIEKNLLGLPVVFTADMNTHEGREAYNTMTTHLRDTRYLADVCESFGTFHNGHPDTQPNSVIDFILCSDNIKVKTYKTVTSGINGRMTSDHFPIYADIIIPY